MFCAVTNELWIKAPVELTIAVFNVVQNKTMSEYNFHCDTLSEVEL